MAKFPPPNDVAYLIVSEDHVVPTKSLSMEDWMKAETRMMKRAGRSMSAYYQQLVNEGKITIEFID